MNCFASSLTCFLSASSMRPSELMRTPHMSISSNDSLLKSRREEQISEKTWRHMFFTNARLWGCVTLCACAVEEAGGIDDDASANKC